MEFHVWQEGRLKYDGTIESTAKYLGKYNTDTFIEACKRAAMINRLLLKIDHLTGECTIQNRKLFDNETAARSKCG